MVESEDADGRRRGWRIVVAEAGAAGAYRIRWYAEDGTARDMAFGAEVATGTVEYISMTFDRMPAGGGVVESRIGGRPVGAVRAIDLGPVIGSAKIDDLLVFEDPFLPGAGAFYHLRELRISGEIRPATDIEETARRLDLPALVVE